MSSTSGEGKGGDRVIIVPTLPMHGVLLWEECDYEHVTRMQYAFFTFLSKHDGLHIKGWIGNQLNTIYHPHCLPNINCVLLCGFLTAIIELLCAAAATQVK